MIANLLIIAFLFNAIFLAYFLGVESGRERAAREIEVDPWFDSADPAAAQYAAKLARGTDG